MVDQVPDRGFVSSPATARVIPAAGGLLLASTADTGGHFTLIRTTVPPRDETPLHRHLNMDESFYVIEGSLDVTCGDDLFQLGAGEFVHLPRGIPHRYVAGTDGAELLIHGTPGGLERFFDDWEDGRNMAELAKAHGIEFIES